MYRIGVGFGGGGQSRDKVGRAGVGSGVIWGSRLGDNKKKEKRKRKEKKKAICQLLGKLGSLENEKSLIIK